jgi:hypothetical protein
MSVGEGSEYRWDVFISHAHEDKASVAVPLAQLLEAAGLRVWLDQQELGLGDSIRAKIDAGLAGSRFGVVVLSKSYFEKRWTANELDSFFVTESDSQTRLLPVWHGVTRAEVARRSPLLAGRKGESTSEGLTSVAKKIAAIVVSASDAPSAVRPSLQRRFLRVLEESRSPESVVMFLRMYPAVVARAVGAGSRDDRMVWDIRTERYPVDCAVGRLQMTIGRFDWTLIRFAMPTGIPVSDSGVRDAEVVQAVGELDGFRAWAGSNVADARKLIPDLEADCMAIVVAGRRELLSAEHRKKLGEWNDELFGTRIRTYDWLAEACAAVSREAR